MNVPSPDQHTTNILTSMQILNLWFPLEIYSTGSLVYHLLHGLRLLHDHDHDEDELLVLVVSEAQKLEYGPGEKGLDYNSDTERRDII